MAQFTSKVQVINEFKLNLAKNDTWVIRGLLVIYNNQTRDEQNILANSHANGIGFTSSDARFMTLMAQYYIKHKKFSTQQMFIVRKNMMKYARQLVDHGLETGKIRKEGKYYVW